MPMRFFIPLILLVICGPFSFAQTERESTAGLIVNTPEFVLPAEARAVGIDGKILVDVTVSAEGKPSNIRLYGGPMWPCKTHPEDEIASVRKAVKNYLLAAKFEPVSKNGKPASADIQFTFVLSDLFRSAQNTALIEKNLKKRNQSSLG